MNICLFTENHYKGGLDSFLINLVNAWPESRDNLTLLSNVGHPGLPFISDSVGIRLKIKTYHRFFLSGIVPESSVLNANLFKYFRSLALFLFKVLQYPVFFPWYVFTLLIFFRFSNYDRLMVVNGGYPASLLCRSAVIAWFLAGKRPGAVMNFHSLATLSSRHSLFLECLIDAMVARSASKFVGVSRACIDSLVQRIAFQRYRNLLYVYNGIADPASQLTQSTEESGTISSNGRYCLMLATYHPYKGHLFLLEAFNEVVKAFPDVRLLIYGYGSSSEKKVVADDVKRLMLQDNVTIGDFTNRTAELMAAASALVIPSQAFESFGLTMIEAMAFGVPVVATNVGGLPEVLGDSNAGYICSKENPLEFARAIKKILANPRMATELGKNGRKAYVQRYSAKRMAISYRLLLE